MKTRTTCRVCGALLEPVLSLGDHYVSDFPRPGESGGQRAPLELALCTQCRLLQLRHTVSPESLYRNYWYRSGTNQTMRSALADIANKAERLIHLRPGDSVLDIGCNDGTLLAAYCTPGIYKIGFDPAENLARFARQVADTVVMDFFSADSFAANERLQGRRPKIITSIAMFYDLEDPGKFVRDVRQVLDPEGLWIIQLSYLPMMLEQNAFDNICHEHLEYYSLQSLEYLLRLYDFQIVDVETNDVNGGSVRVYARNQAADEETFADPTYRGLARDRIRQMTSAEQKLELDRTEPYLDFAWRVGRIKELVVDMIRREVGCGKRVYVYGASTKGNTLLQYFGLDSSLIGAAVERNPDKWGRVTVGTDIPIISEQEGRAAKPDYLLILPWHFIKEFKQRERDFLRGGGRFILPLPEFTVI